MAMLEPDPRRRPNAAECVRLLSGPSAQFEQTASVRRPEPVAAHLPTEPSRAPRSPGSPAARGRSRRIALSVAAFAALAAGGTAVALTLGTGKGPPSLVSRALLARQRPAVQRQQR